MDCNAGGSSKGSGMLEDILPVVEGEEEGFDEFMTGMPGYVDPFICFIRENVSVGEVGWQLIGIQSGCASYRMFSTK